MTAYPFSQVQTGLSSDRAVGREAVAPRAELKAKLGRYILRWPKLVWMIADAGWIALGSALSIGCGLAGRSPSAAVDPRISPLVLASAIVLAGMMFSLYEPQTLWQRSRIAARSLLAAMVATLLSTLVLHLLLPGPVPHRVILGGLVMYLFVGPTLRIAAHEMVSSVRRGLLLIGLGQTTAQVIRSVRRGAVPGYQLVGLVAESVADLPDIPGLPHIGTPADAAELCAARDVREVVVAAGLDEHPAIQEAALACLRLGCRVTDEVTFYEKAFGEVPAPHISPRWFLLADLKGHLREQVIAKRIFDLLVAASGLVLALPLAALILLAIRLGGRGPILYSQVRVGQAGRRFRLYKFRTMRTDAESAGSMWAARNDPRVTRVGRLLRRTRLDELPQLWNVLRGDMSIVGPRPERPEFVAPLASLIPFFGERHLIKPGLTGWAQINFRYGNSIADARKKLQLDLYYIKHMSVELDLVICLRTIGLILTGAS